MCISDPKFLKTGIIWYIQGLSGSSYKALGVAKRKEAPLSSVEVVPIEEPAAGGGMHADPVAVRVTLDREAGVISVSPIQQRWSPGQLDDQAERVPFWQSRCPWNLRPVRQTLPDGKLLNPWLVPLKPQKRVSCACPGRLHFLGLVPAKKTSTLTLYPESGNDPKFLSVGFVSRSWRFNWYLWPGKWRG